MTADQKKRLDLSKRNMMGKMSSYGRAVKAGTAKPGKYKSQKAKAKAKVKTKDRAPIKPSDVSRYKFILGGVPQRAKIQQELDALSAKVSAAKAAKKKYKLTRKERAALEAARMYGMTRKISAINKVNKTNYSTKRKRPAVVENPYGGSFDLWDGLLILATKLFASWEAWGWKRSLLTFTKNTWTSSMVWSLL
jgi:hypothetical protein